MLISNFPTFSYATWQGLIIISADKTPYVINDGNTDCKYVYWETSNPYTLKATDEKLSVSASRYLIYFNDGGIASEVPQDVIGIQYREGSGVLISKIAGQVSELDGKYYAIKEDIDGLEKIIGSSTESEDGSLVDRVNKLEQTAEGTYETIKQVETTYYKDKESEELRDSITEALIAMATALGEYQEVVSSACEDFKITDEEKVEIQEAQNKFVKNANSAFECHDTLVGKIVTDENIKEIKALNNAKSNLQNAITNLNTNVNTSISDNTVVPSEITIMLNMFGNIGVKANEYKETLSEAMVLGIGGEVVENIFSTTKTATEFNQRMANITEVIDPETGLPALVKQNETNINQTAENIKLNYVKFDKVTSEITVADEVIKLDASTVLMTGTLTWDSLDDDAKSNLKGEKGDNGSAQYVMLTGDQLIKYDANGNPSRTSILITAMTSGITDIPSIIWKYKAENSGEWKDITSNINKTYYSLLANDTIWNEKDSITIRVIVNNTYYDDFTVVKVRDGIDGTLAEYVEIDGDGIFKYTIKKGTTTFTPTPSVINLEGKAHNITTTNTKWYYRRPSDTGWTLMSNYNGKFAMSISPDDTTLFPNDNDVVQIKFELNTHSDIKTITKLYDGQDSVMAVLSNENHAIPCKSDGTPTTYVGATTDLSIYVGSINDTQNWTISIDTNGVTGEASNNNKTFTVTNILGDVGYVDFVALKDDFDSVTKRFTVTKSKNGLDGFLGEDSISYWIVTSASAIVKKSSHTTVDKDKENNDNTENDENKEENIEIIEEGNETQDKTEEIIDIYEPSSIEISAKCKEGKKEVCDYEGIFKIYEKEKVEDEEVWVEKYVSMSNESKCIYKITSSNDIKVELYEDETFIDEEHIPVLTDGETTPIAFLDNDSHVIPCNFNGMPLNYEGATTTIHIYAGSVDDSENWTYSITETNLHGVITNNNRTYTVTGIDSDTAYIDIVAKKEGFDDITRRFTVTKAINGTDGASAKYIYITGEQVFKYSENFEGIPTPNTITLTATKHNIDSLGKWQYKNGDTYTDMGFTSETLTVTPSSGAFPTQNVSTFRYIAEDYYDEITIIKISDGTNGLPGSDGEDSIYILLSNENHSVPCDNEGNYTEEDLAKATTEIFVYKGLDEIPFKITSLKSEGCTGYFKEDKKIVGVTNLTENSAKVTISINVENKIFTKVMSISKALQGGAGSGINVLGTLADISALPNSGNVNDAYLIDGKMYIWSLEKNQWVEGATVGAIKGDKGADGQTSYFHIKYANNIIFDENGVAIDGEWTAQGTDLEGEEIGDWIGFYTDFYKVDSTKFSAYKWKNIKGEQGENGIVVNLTNDSHIIPCASDGTTNENSFIGCETKISLFLGAEELDDGVSYDYEVSNENIGVIFDSNTGTCAVKEMNNIDNGYIILTAHYNGVGYSKRFTITKSKQGEDAITINLSNENHTFLANSEGKIEVAQNVEILISVFKGSNPIGFTIGGLPNVNGLTIIKDEKEGKIEISTDTTTELAKNGTINIPIAIEGVSYTKQFSYTRVDSGKDGTDGLDGYTVYLTNENHSFYCESNGSILEEQSVITTVKAYFGAKEMTPTIGTISSVEGLSISKNGATITIKTAGKVLASNGSFNIPIIVDNKQFIKTFSWSKAFKGADGQDGVSASYVVVSGDQVFKYAKGSTTPTPSQILLNASRFNIPSTSVGKWQYKYNGEYIDLGVSTNILTVTPSTGTLVDMGSCTFRYIVDNIYDEITVVEVSDGIDGNSGQTFYTWIMYADDDKGTNISNNPTNKKYIGLSYNNETSTESTDPTKYQWSLIKGSDGIPGAKGEDGVTYYTWIKYSDSSDGSNMYDTPNTNTEYIGIAVNKTVQTESTNKSDYKWSKFRGDDGVDGKDSYTVILTNENHSFVAESDGKIANAISTTCQVIAYKGNNAIAPTIGSITNPSGLTITKNGTTLTVTATVGTSLAENGSVNIPITVDGIKFNRTFSWTKVKKGIKGDKGDPGSAANVPDWVAQWDSGKTTINNTTVLAPKIFAGSVSSGKPTGVAMGVNVFGTSGTYSNISGIAGYKNGTKTYHFSTDGSMLLGSTSGQYISWDGSNLKMNVNSLSISSDSVATVNAINDAISSNNTTLANTYATKSEVTSNSIVNKVTSSESWKTQTSNISTAKSTADSAKSTADTNKSNISSLATRVSSAEQKITSTAIVSTVTSSTSWSNLSGDVSGLATRMSSAEQKITSNAIVSTVTSSTNWKDLNSTASTAKSTADTAKSTADSAKTTANSAKSTADSASSSVTQLANKFNWVVASGTSQSNMTLTDKMYSLISANVTIQASKIKLEGYTTVNGNFKIDTSGNMIAKNGTFTGNITGGTITGSKIIGQGTGNRVLINNADYEIQTGTTSKGFFGLRTLDDGYEACRLALSTTGLRRANDNYLVIQPYNKNANPQSYAYPYVDIAYRCNGFAGDDGRSDVSNIKIYGDGVMRISPIKTLQITTNFSGGSYGGSGERDIAQFGSSSSEYYPTYLDVRGCIRNHQSNHGLIISAKRTDDGNTFNARAVVYTDGFRTFAPVKFTSDNVPHYLGSGSHRWQTLYSVNSVNTSSDITLKENIKYLCDTPNARAIKSNELNIQDMYNFIRDDLFLTSYNWIEDPEKEEKLGFIAQDIVNTKVGEKIIICNRDRDDTLGYDSGNFEATIAGALKVNINKTEIMQKEIDTLKNEIAQLKEIINNLVDKL